MFFPNMPKNIRNGNNVLKRKVGQSTPTVAHSRLYFLLRWSTELQLNPPPGWLVLRVQQRGQSSHLISHLVH